MRKFCRLVAVMKDVGSQVGEFVERSHQPLPQPLLTHAMWHMFARYPDETFVGRV